MATPTATLNADRSVSFYEYAPDGALILSQMEPDVVVSMESMVAGWVTNGMSQPALTPAMVIIANLAVEDGLITSTQLSNWATTKNIQVKDIFTGTPTQGGATYNQSFVSAINDPDLTTAAGAPTATEAQKTADLGGVPETPAHVYVDNTYTEAVQRAYIAYYGRPADTGGVDWWADQLAKQNGSLESIINGFGNSAEANSLYGTGGATERITKIYDQLFDRAPDAGGLSYWVGEINAGRVSTASAALQILWGASGSDKARIDNKLLVAKAFTTAIDTQTEIGLYSGDTAAANARNFLELVNADASRASQMAGGANNITTKIDGSIQGELQIIGIPTSEINDAWLS